MRLTRIHGLAVVASLTMVLAAGCGGYDEVPPNGPAPAPATANAYILPNAVSLGDFAFGDEPVVIFRGERLRWINADTLAHIVVADSPDATDFRTTVELPGNGAEQSFVMTRIGSTRIHCSIHPTMAGTLIVRER